MFKSISIYFIAFITGFVLMGYEILGIRILAPYFGSSSYVWGALISTFLMGLSIGYIFGGRIADKNCSFKRLGYLIFCALIFIMPISFFGAPLCKLFSTLNLDIRYSALLTSIVIFIVPCICLGGVTPYLSKLLVKDIKFIGKNVGNVFAASSIGSIIGTLFVSFYMIRYVGTRSGILLLCLPLVVSIVVVYISSLLRVDIIE